MAEEYTQIAPDFIGDLISSGIESYDANKNFVSDFKPHKVQYSNEGFYSNMNAVPGEPIYIKTKDLNTLITFIDDKNKKAKLAEDEMKDKNTPPNVKIIKSVQDYITTIISGSDILSQNNKDSFLDKIKQIVDTLVGRLDRYSTVDKKSVLLAICSGLTDKMNESLLFSSDVQSINTIENNDIVIKGKGRWNSNIYSLKINAPHIIFFYNFNNTTLSLSKIETGKEYTITLNWSRLTIDTIPPLITEINSGPRSNIQNMFYIYKLQEPIDDATQTKLPEPIETHPFRLMNDVDEAERNARGGKRTRKQMYSARSRGIITLKNADAFRKQMYSARSRRIITLRKKRTKGRRKIERSRSFRNKR